MIKSSIIKIVLLNLLIINLIYSSIIELSNDNNVEVTTEKDILKTFVTTELIEDKNIKISAEIKNNPENITSEMPIIYISSSSNIENLKETAFICNLLVKEECIASSALINKESKIYISLQGCHNCTYELHYNQADDNAIEINAGKLIYIQLLKDVNYAFKTQLKSKKSLVNMFSLNNVEFKLDIINTSSNYEYVSYNCWSGCKEILSKSLDTINEIDRNYIEFYIKPVEDSYFTIQSYSSDIYDFHIDHPLYSIEEISPNFTKCYVINTQNNNLVKFDSKILKSNDLSKIYISENGILKNLSEESIIYINNNNTNNKICLLNKSYDIAAIQIQLSNINESTDIYVYKNKLKGKSIYYIQLILIN